MAKASSTMPKELRVARAEIEKGIDRVARSVGEIRVALERAERKIEADARGRIRALRKEAKAELAVVLRDGGRRSARSAASPPRRPIRGATSTRRQSAPSGRRGRWPSR